MNGARVNQHVCIIRPCADVDSQFVSWFLASPLQQDHIMASQTGATRQGLTKEKLLRFELPIPPFREQQRISNRIDELFSELDAGVTALKRVQSNLKRYRASVLKAAVEGKLTEEWRAEHAPKETGQQLLDRILKERRQRWEAEQLAAYEAKGKQPPKDWQARYKQPEAPDTTDLPPLPEGWCWAAVNQVGDVQLGRQRSPKHHSGPHMRPYLRVANVFEDRIDTSDVMQMNFTPAEFETFSLKFGDILLNEGQSFELIGRPAMYRDEVPGACFTNTLVRFRANEELNRDFALRVFLAYLKSKRFQKIATITVNIAHLGAGRFAEIEFPLPPEDEQAEIVRLVDELFTQIDAAEKFVEQGLLRAARLRQSILKDAFEGRLVAQDPADEPASELLARIEAARQPVVQKSASTTPQRRVPKEITHRRAAVVAYMISHIGQNGSTAKTADSLGRTKLAKALYIAQTHEELDLQFRFQRYAAGPFDEALFNLEGTAKKNEWFVTKERDHFGVTYHTAPKTEPMSQQAAKFLGDNRGNFDRLLGHIDTMDMQQAELFATAYAAWNDLLIDGREINDDTIIDEFYAWDESKQKFSRTAIHNQLKWMRSEGYVPSGKGERTQPRDKKTKLPSRKRRTT